MKNKKIFVLLSALALSLAACGSKPGSSSQGGGDSQSSSSTSQQESASSSQQGSQSSNPASSSQTDKSSSDSGSQTVPVTSLALNKTTLSLEEGKSETLTVTVTPSNATDATVTWESSDTTVATVSRLGKVSAVKAGTATITVKSNSNPSVKAECALTVTEEGGKYGSVNKPKTVAQILAIAAEECKNANDKTADQVYVKGFVSKAPTNKGTFSQNIYLKDALSDTTELLVYTANHDELKEPYKNDQVVLHGYLMNYNGTIEISNVTIGTDKIYPAVDTVTRGTSSISYTIEHGSVNADAPKSGKNLSEFSFSVTPEANYKVDNVLANGNELTAQADGSYKAVIKGDMTVQINISEVGVEILSATMQYTAGTTTNMGEGNNAAIVGLDATLFNVTSTNNTGNYCGLGADGSIRLYDNRKDETEANRTNGTILTVSSVRATIKRITITRTADCAGLLQVKAGDSVVTGADYVYDINASSFSLQNVVALKPTDNGSQFRFSKLVLTYTMNAEVKAEAIAVSPKTMELEVGNDGQLAAALTPANATDVVVWSSSAEGVATVDQTGKVTAVAEGSATITAKVSDTIKDTATITVKAAKVINYGTAEAPLTVAQAKAVLDETGTSESKQPLYVKGIVSQNTAYDNGYSNYGEVWLQSDDGSNAKEFELYRVKLDASVTNLPTAQNGLAGYEVVATGFGKIYRDTYELTTSSNEPKNPLIVAATAPAPTEATGVSLDVTSKELEAGEQLQLTATLSPAGATGTVAWSSSAEGVATVDQTGKVTAVAAGTATITAKVSDSVKATCAITVKAAPQLEPLAEAVTLSYTGLTAKGSEISADDALTKVGQGNSHVKAVELTKIYDGNASGGAYANTAGFLKTGTSSVAGKIKLTLDGLANKVEILCHDFNKKSDSYPTNSNTFAVNNSATQLAPYNETATFETLTFELAEASKTITIDINKRAYIKEIKISYAQAEIAQPKGKFFAAAELGEGKSALGITANIAPIFIEFGEDNAVSVNFNGMELAAAIKSYNKTTGELVITAAQVGDVSMTWNPETARLEKLAIAAAPTLLKWNGGQSLRGNDQLKHWSMDGSDSELQAQFDRRYGSSSWTKDETNANRIVSEETAKRGKAARVLKDPSKRYSLATKDFSAKFKATNLSFWVYNDGEAAVKIQIFGYKSTGWTNYFEIQSDKEIQPGWTFFSRGFSETEMYGFQIIAKTDAVSMVYDDICLF